MNTATGGDVITGRKISDKEVKHIPWWRKKWRNNNCPICTQIFRCDRGKMTVTRCNHKFHEKCLLKYYQDDYEDIKRCPLCRSLI